MNVSQDRKKTQATYDSLSRFYDLMSGSTEDRARQQAVNLLNIKADDVLLEIGCGTGAATIVMGKKVGTDGHVFGIDLSIKMLSVAQKKLRQKGEQISVGLCCGDAVRLPFSSQSVSGIMMSFALELFPDAEITSVLSECARVLCQGGRLCVLSMSKWQSKGFMFQMYQGLQKRFPTWIDCRPILLAQTLAGNGFKVVESRQSSLFGLPIEIVLAVPEGKSKQL